MMCERSYNQYTTSTICIPLEPEGQGVCYINWVPTKYCRSWSFINDRGVIIALYVDDILVFGKDIEDIESTKDRLRSFHPMKDLGLALMMLGSGLPKQRPLSELIRSFMHVPYWKSLEWLNQHPRIAHSIPASSWMTNHLRSYLETCMTS